MATGTVTANTQAGGFNTSDGTHFASATDAQSHQNAINSASSGGSTSSSTSAASKTSAAATTPAAGASSATVKEGGAQSAATPYGAEDGTYYSTYALAQAQNAKILAAHTAATGGGTAAATTPAATTPAATTPAATTPAATSTSTSTSTSQLLTLLQQALANDIGSSATTVPTPAQIDAMASQYASLQADPQLTALQNQLVTDQTQEANQVSQIQAAYSQVPEQTATAINNAHQQAADDAAARGAGTSGVADYDTQQLETPILEAEQTSLAQSAASQAGAANTLAADQAVIANSQSSLAQQQGQIASQYAESLNEFYTSAQNGDYTSMVNTLLGLDNIAAGLGENGSVIGGTGAGTATTPAAPTTTTTPAVTPGTLTATAAPAGTTDLVSSIQGAGGTVTYNAVDKSVSVVVNGLSNTYSQSDLLSMGCSLVTINGASHWYVSPTALSKMGVS